MTNSLDLTRNTDARVADLAWLAANSRAWVLNYEEAAEAAELIRGEHARLSPVAKSSVSLPQPLSVSAGGLRRARHTTTAVIDGQAVIVHHTTRVVARLDPSGTSEWLAIDEARTPDPKLLASLQNLGLIEEETIEPSH